MIVVCLGKVSAAGEHEYHLRSVAAGVEENYPGSGEAPGWWLGRGASACTVGSGDHRIADGCVEGKDPATGSSLWAMSGQACPAGI